MLLKEALITHKNSKWKIDILELLWIEVRHDYCMEEFYKNKVNKLTKWRYFISDLDWTFFRWTLIKEAFVLYAKYLKDLNIEKIDLDRYKEFLDDYKLYKDIEKDAYNKKIKYDDYLNAWMFILNKYHNLTNWDDFLVFLKEFFHRKQKVNPFRFSIKKMKEVLENWDQFLFVSWASSFVFEIYLELLKDYIWRNIWENYIDQIHWISSYVDFDKKHIYNMWNKDWKYEFITQLLKKDIVEEIIGWMWDTSSDYGISNHLPENTPFYFINPAYTAISEHNKLAKKWVGYNFIFERKDLIFKYDINNIKILN